MQVLRFLKCLLGQHSYEFIDIHWIDADNLIGQEVFECEYCYKKDLSKVKNIYTGRL